MNLYIRYFNEEALVSKLDEALDFISMLPEVQVTDRLASEIRDYIESDNIYPKRYKVKARVYFILIKTLASSLEEFKTLKNAGDTASLFPKDIKMVQLNQKKLGWYECEINFKRVVPIIGTEKFQYNDTPFIAIIKGESAINCYDRLLDYLKNRQDIDLRSQFPSAKGANFSFKYRGETLPDNVLA